MLGHYPLSLLCPYHFWYSGLFRLQMGPWQLFMCEAQIAFALWKKHLPGQFLRASIPCSPLYCLSYLKHHYTRYRDVALWATTHHLLAALILFYSKKTKIWKRNLNCQSLLSRQEWPFRIHYCLRRILNQRVIISYASNQDLSICFWEGI